MAWKKGQSGNPTGKKPGQTPRGKFREQVEHALPDIVAGLVTAALGGDMQATKIIMDRCIPALKPTDDGAKVAVRAGADLVAQGAAVVKAMAAGAITTAQAKDAMAVLSGQRALVDQSEIIERFEMLEIWRQRQPAKP